MAAAMMTSLVSQSGACSVGLTWLLILQLMDQSVLPHYQHHDPTMINTDHEERTNCRPFSRQTLICCDISPLCSSEGVLCLFRLVKNPGGGLDSHQHRLFEFSLKSLESVWPPHIFIRGLKQPWQDMDMVDMMKRGKKQSFSKCSRWKKHALYSLSLPLFFLTLLTADIWVALNADISEAGLEDATLRVRMLKG